MNFKTSIKDFQIIKKATLEFTPGLNVIIGPSNNGKTSILKAIKAALYTVPGSTPIRFGQSSYAVGINYNNHTIIFQKGTKESIYIVDGEKYTKFGVNTPPAVSEALNIKELILNNNKEQLNFWDQMNYPFLLDKTSTELFRFIIDSGDDDQVSKVLKTMVSDRQLISKNIDILQGGINVVDAEINQYKEDLAKAKPILDACKGIIGLQSSLVRLNSLSNFKASLDEIYTQKQNLDKLYNQSKTDLKIWNDFNQTIILISKRYNTAQDLFIRLGNINKSILDLNNNLKNINLNKNIDLSKTLELSRLKDFLAKINYIREHRNSLKAKSQITCQYSEDDLNKLSLLKSCLTAHRNINKKQIDTNTNTVNCKNSIEYYTELSKLFNVCPLCGNKIHN